ncbi:hypothetical protein SUGI_0011330 [Cryptomeria japonica]|nr:hypothetical protein SUGI_0011330 [Cryptomeria japonica]
MSYVPRHFGDRDGEMFFEVDSPVDYFFGISGGDHWGTSDHPWNARSLVVLRRSYLCGQGMAREHPMTSFCPGDACGAQDTSFMFEGMFPCSVNMSLMFKLLAFMIETLCRLISKKNLNLADTV